MSHSIATKIMPLVAAMMLAVGCSTQANDKDPLEGYNRLMFDVNHGLDTVLLKPVAQGYRYVAPEAIRTRLGNASDNLYEPVSMLNAFLQGNFDQGARNFFRFLINSSVGLGGMHDIASEAGIPSHYEDLGQTLAVWGVDAGPYIVLPLFGPSNARDTVGLIANIAATPTTYVNSTAVSVGISAGQIVVERERLLDPIDDIYATSLDPYASFRSVYEQRRDADIKSQVSEPKHP